MNSSPFLDIRSFGAIGDGQTLNTKAIQQALDAVGAGGVVLVPAGTWLTGSIFLRSNTVLELLPGATLLGSTRLEDYTRLTTGIVGDRTGYHLVVADGVQNVTIRGQGTIDGNGPAFWEPTEGDRLVEYPKRAPSPAAGPVMWIKALRATDGRPSPMVELRHSQDVRVEGVRLTNPAGWTLHAFDCDRVWIRGVTIAANLMGPNNDGIDITECRDVMISDCDISCCDDAVCLKTYPGGRACERVTVTNCVIRTRCVAFKTGEAYGHFRQVTFSNSVVYECSRAVALYAHNDCLVEDVVISNIVCDTRSPLLVTRPIHIEVRRDVHKQPNSDGIPQDKSPPIGIRNVSISNFIARTDGRVMLVAEEGFMLENITLRDLHIIYPTVDDPDPIAARMGCGQFAKANPAARLARGAVVAENVRGLVIDGLRVDWPAVDAQGRVNTPAEWRFPIKGANGIYELFERDVFNRDVIPDFSVIWGRNLQGGYVRAPMAQTPRPNLSRFDLANCTIAIES